ncbi:MAG: hypothetical protein R2813_03150 [Flavobacteriales bacterium]
MNRGIFVHNVSEQDGNERTIIVFGIPRSGTTMAAKVLRSIGVDMGNSDNPVAEDTEMARILEKSGSPEQLRDYIKDRNERSSVWGWKRPESFRYRDKFIKELRNPHIVILFRDPLAIAIRENISMGENVLSKLSQSIKRYEAIVRFVGNTNLPCMLVSYEKAIQDPKALVQAMAAFTGLVVDNKTVEATIEQIQLNDPTYLRSTKKKENTLRGAVEQIDQNGATGWAKYTRMVETPIVRCFLGDQEIGYCKASELRNDLSDRLNGSLEVGFHIKFKKPIGVYELSSLNFCDSKLNETLRIKRKAIAPQD